MTASTAPREWQRACPVDELEVGRGVTVLAHGQAIAVFRVDDGTVHALGNHDPFAHSASGGLAKGIVGRRDGHWFVGSPAHRHGFDLRTGRCLDDPHVAVPVYRVKVARGTVLIGSRRRR
ncbi:nitrite reductase small subunit NirD [Nocardioides panacisoli]|uniref:nitrite reductase small subunit NirD n=1 Tax=Nocardioides panacisoli TaxID=627624 RepID=UPI001C63AC92|nr:nitrite reductase small subunit NirD [Nocardioides panacisoli]QYJ02697.1 nitrite reductase small subunit NirD [Nocardioides panacisoli]